MLLLGLATARADHGDLDGAEDFALLARRGFAEVVDGTQGVLVPEPLGSRSNSYPWSMEWFEGQLWVGTVRDVLCFLGGRDTDSVTCEPGEAGELPLPGADQRAEMWRYTPAGAGGIGGTWERVFQSPFVGFPVDQAVPADTPRDVGYRGACISDAGGGVPRLYVATLGVPGRILYWNGTTFVQASTIGLRLGLTDLSQGTYDLGYRSLVHFQGRLWTSPVGTLTDTDLSDNPVLLANSGPSRFGAWQEIVHVQQDPVLGDADNNSIFKMLVHDGWLYLAVTNRVTGMQVWRTNGQGCTNPAAPCHPTFERVIVDGGARPPDGSSPLVDNTIGELGSFGPYVYVAGAEAAALDSTRAELLRIRPDGRWELVVGWTRRDFPTIPSFHCATPVDVDGDGPDDCQPLSGRAPGMGSSVTSQGAARYFWRITEHEGALFVGTLDTSSGSSSNPAGFDLWRSTDGAAFTLVSNDGFGNPRNYGVRTLLSTPVGLALGAANPYSDLPDGGLEVFLGTTLPSVPPVAVAGADQLLFDSESAPAPGDGSVTATLDGSRSNAPFGGHLAGLAWYQGDRTGVCATLVEHPFADGTVVPGVGLPTGPVATQHPFTLRAVDDEGRVHCDAVVVTASHDLRPTVAITTDPPTVRRTSTTRVRLVDFDGDGSESFRLRGTCTDPEGLIAACGWTLEEGVSLEDPAALDTAATGVATVGGADRAVRLVARDIRGYEGSTTVEVNVESVPADVPDVNQEPLCANSGIVTTQDREIVFDPFDPSHRRCLDVDDADAVLTLETRQSPAHGTWMSATRTYTPAPGYSGADAFQVRACDPAGGCSSSVSVGVTVLPDRDADGVADEVDTCPDLAAAPQADRDGDGAGDACDNCIVFANPGQDEGTTAGVGAACGIAWADLAPRGAPDGAITTLDLVVMARFARGTEMPSAADFDRANVAPAAVSASDPPNLTPTGAEPRTIDDADLSQAARVLLGRDAFTAPR